MAVPDTSRVGPHKIGLTGSSVGLAEVGRPEWTSIGTSYRVDMSQQVFY
jgi:hypothetical protein